MNKSEILALIDKCRNEISLLLLNDSLPLEVDEYLENLDKSLLNDKKRLSELEVDSIIEESLKTAYEYYQKNYEELSTYRSLLSNKMVTYDSEKHKVVKVIPEEKQKKETKKERKGKKRIIIICLLLTGTIALTALISGIVNKLSKKDNTDDKNNTPESSISQSIDTPIQDEFVIKTFKSIDEVNLDNLEDIVAYSNQIKEQLKDSDLTVKDITAAIRLANFDHLENKVIFNDRASVYDATTKLGKIASTIGTSNLVQKSDKDDIFVSENDLNDMISNVTNNNISINQFATAKSTKGYDIYTLCDLCVTHIKENNNQSVYFSKLFNEIMANESLAFSITANSPISTRYTLLGLYSENKKEIAKQTAGRLWGPIYGSGTQIDNSYGFICVEELQKYLTIGNKDNILNTEIIDQNILVSKQRKLN